MGDFDELIQSRSLVIPKITFDNLCKPIHNVVIIPVSSDPWNLEAAEKKEKNCKKLNILRTKWAF